MRTTDMNDYDNIFHTIHRDIEKITHYAKTITNSHDFKEDLDSFKQYGDLRGFDYWDAYGDNVDLNFCSNMVGTEVICTAYPVWQGIPNYDEKYMVRVPLNGRSTEGQDA